MERRCSRLVIIISQAIDWREHDEDFDPICFVADGRHLLCRRHCYFVFRERLRMDFIEHLIAALDELLNSDRKRHITGGILLSAAALFSGLAITAMTIRKEETIDE